MTETQALVLILGLVLSLGGLVLVILSTHAPVYASLTPIRVAGIVIGASMAVTAFFLGYVSLTWN